MINIKAWVTEAGVPQTGLTPVIDVYEVVTKTKVVDNQNMEEIGSGWYKYPFTNYDQHKNYVYRIDGTATITSATERYQYEELDYHIS